MEYSDILCLGHNPFSWTGMIMQNKAWDINISSVIGFYVVY